MKTITVKMMDTGEVIQWEAVEFWIIQSRCFASLKRTHLVAELDLCNTDKGWEIYPN